MQTIKKISNKISEITINNPAKPEEKSFWININNAGKDELDWLRKKFNFKLSHLQASSAKIMAQRSIIEKNEDYVFMVLRLPVLTDNKITSEEIDFFVNKDYLITLHDNKLKSLNDIFNLYKKGGDIPEIKHESVISLLYGILKRSMDGCFALLDANGAAIDKLEDAIFGHKAKIAAANIFALRLNIINTRKALQNHQNIIGSLLEYTAGFDPENGREPIEKIHEDAKTIWLNLESQKEIVEVLNSANESFMNYHISDIMKTLTIFSVIVFPLTLLAAIFGMNTVNGMPFMESTNGFWMIIIIMLFSSLGMLIFFKKKKWL